MCSDIFGWRHIDYSAMTNERATLNTNKLYGGRYNYKATNVVMTHGSLDPWKTLGKEKCEESDNCFMIEGAAHCAEMYPAHEEDSPQLTEIRSKIEKIIGEWVGQHNSNIVDEEQRPPNNMDTNFQSLVIGKNSGKNSNIQIH
uniref:Peptidase S28 domain containing protein n=1 Tax=Haemonchus contortus TaxID=6289 RepID=W6NXJ9_HAECO